MLKTLAYPRDAGRKDSTIKTVDEFLEAAKVGKADVADACALLQRSYNELQDLGLEEQRLRASQVGGGRILHWLWSREKSLWREAFDRDFAGLLCWHLDAEGRDDFVAQWLTLMSRERNESPETQQGRQREMSEWTGPGQAAIVKAKLYWNGTAEAAIMAFSAALTRDRSKHTHMVQPTALLERTLKNAFVRPVSPAAFRTFLGLVKIAHNGQHQALSLSSAALFHPTSPQADDHLQVYRSEKLLESIRTWRIPGKAAQVNYLTRAIYILLLQGRYGDVKILEDIAVSLDPHSWSYRFKNYRECREDPKLEQFHLDSPFTQQVWDEIADEEKRTPQPRQQNTKWSRLFKKSYPSHKVFHPA